MSSSFLHGTVTVLVLCALFLGAQYHPASATSVITSGGVGPSKVIEGCNGPAVRNFESGTILCQPSSATVELSTSKTITPQVTTYITLITQTTPYNPLTTQTTYAIRMTQPATNSTLMTQTTTYDTLTTQTTSVNSSTTPTMLAAVTTITCTASAAIPNLKLNVVPFIWVTILGVVHCSVL